jgi:arsenate reductase
VSRRLVAEFIGSAFLLMAVVGGGIAAQRLSPTDQGLQLLEAAIVTALILGGLIAMLGPISGAHFNPAVTIAEAALGARPWSDVAPYVAAQVAGGVIGTVLANLMFELQALQVATTVRSGGGQWLGEVVATLGLLLVIFLMVRAEASFMAIGPAVGAYIGGAYFFTSSTSFANPAVTVARTLTDTFAGIDPSSAAVFIVMQMVGVGVALVVIRSLDERGA